MYRLVTKHSEKRTADITSQSGIRLSELKTHVAHCAANGTVYERKSQ